MASALACAAPACLIPPPVDEVDPAANRAPTVTAFTPPDGTPVTLSCDVAFPAFAAVIDDPDTRDTLYYRFFIDYNLQDAADLLAILPTQSPPLPNNAPRYAQPEVPITGRNPIIQERPNEVHIVQVVVVDREFDDSETANGFVARTPMAGGLSNSYQWFVEPVVCN